MFYRYNCCCSAWRWMNSWFGLLFHMCPKVTSDHISRLMVVLMVIMSYWGTTYPIRQLNKDSTNQTARWHSQNLDCCLEYSKIEEISYIFGYFWLHGRKYIARAGVVRVRKKLKFSWSKRKLLSLFASR